jgi:hypothetical protein
LLARLYLNCARNVFAIFCASASFQTRHLPSR